jgi:hypothetical protein
MNAPAKENLVATVIQWIASISGVLVVGFLIAFVIGRRLWNPEEPTPTPDEWIGLALFPGGVIVGTILALKWAGLGGIIAVGSVAVFYVSVFINEGRLPGPWPAVLAVPGFLFLIRWLILLGSQKTNEVNGL